jgi:hypothetical protein
VTTAGVTWIACATELAVVAGGVLLSMRVGFLFFGDDEMRAAATEGARSFVHDAVPALLAATAAMLWLRRRFVTAAGLRAFRMAAATVLVFFVYHAAVRPGLDPMRDMSAGAREVASLVPADEPILLLHSDETMRAAIPFYTGRDVLNAVEVKHVMKALDAGRAKHLVVMDKHDEKITPELRARLVLLSNVRINASRTMDVYEVRAP